MPAMLLADRVALHYRTERGIVINVTDKNRVEMALPPRLMRRIMAAIIEGTRGASHPVAPPHLVLLEDLGTCCEDALYGLPSAKKEKLRARLDRAAHSALLPYERDSLMKSAMMVLYWTVDRLECGDLSLGDGSLFEGCFSRLQNGLAEHEDLWNAVNRSAVRQTAKFHQQIQSLGYF